MGPPIKVLFAVSLAVLLVQCGARKNADAEGIEDSSTDKTWADSVTDGVQDVVPVPTDEKRSVALLGLDSSIDDIVVEMEQHLEIETKYVEKISRSVARASKIEKVKKMVKRFLQVNRRDIGQTRNSVRDIICNKYQNFKRLTTLVKPSDPDIIEPCFNNKLEPTTTRLNKIIADPQRNYRRIRRDQKALMKQSEGLYTLEQWKGFYENKVKTESVATYKNELNAIKEASLKALKTLYNAYIVWDKLDVDMKDGLKYPSDVDGKVELVQAAINTGTEFGCEAMLEALKEADRAEKRKRAAARKEAATAAQRAPGQAEIDD
ncbi:unnamed protein product [Bemisia tabaci]|uniref:Uncharacterized protein n=1 Tax=Bemisia tabaci TaxID=7038 RepID=A0A9P0F4A4_BEMTA|nr:unnamed protein product [Bemisia tabaci]